MLIPIYKAEYYLPKWTLFDSHHPNNLPQIHDRNRKCHIAHRTSQIAQLTLSSNSVSRQGVSTVARTFFHGRPPPLAQIAVDTRPCI
jgi:hypothetical protein